MESSHSVMHEAVIVREFLQNEARTLHISKGKIIKDSETEKVQQAYLKVS